MNSHLRRIAPVVGALALGLAASSHARAEELNRSAYVDASGDVVHCVSLDSGRTYCGAPHVRYVLRGTPDGDCVEGNTWGVDDRGVWVSGGCKADFSVVQGDEVTRHSSYVNSEGNVVHCVSTASGRTYCGKPHVRYVLRQDKDPACVEGSTWGHDDRGVWVSGACSADFDVATDNPKPADTVTERSTYVTDSGRIVHCVSTESGRTYCGAHHAHYVVEGAPNPACVEGSTWGVDDHGLWVTGGCRGDFAFDDD